MTYLPKLGFSQILLLLLTLLDLHPDQTFWIKAALIVTPLLIRIVWKRLRLMAIVTIALTVAAFLLRLTEES